MQLSLIHIYSYTTSQLARYALTIRNNGVSYDLNLLDKVTDSSGNLLEEFSPQISKQTQLSQVVWDCLLYTSAGRLPL